MYQVLVEQDHEGYRTLVPLDRIKKISEDSEERTRSVVVYDDGTKVTLRIEFKSLIQVLEKAGVEVLSAGDLFEPDEETPNA